MLLCLWDSPGKNIGVGCPFLLWRSSWPRDYTQVSCIAGRFFTTELQGKHNIIKKCEQVLWEHRKADIFWTIGLEVYVDWWKNSCSEKYHSFSIYLLIVLCSMLCKGCTCFFLMGFVSLGQWLCFFFLLAWPWWAVQRWRENWVCIRESGLLDHATWSQVLPIRILYNFTFKSLVQTVKLSKKNSQRTCTI